MAVLLLSHDASDLCIGKPPLTSLPSSATAAEALAALRRAPEKHLTVWAAASGTCLGKLSVVDVVCFLCAPNNLADPIAALRSPVSDLLQKDRANLVRRVESHSSVLDALDVILEGAQNLLVPIRQSARKKALHRGGNSAMDFCSLTQEDFMRFFLGSISLFSPVPGMSIETLGLIHPDPLAIRHGDAALPAAPLLKLAAASQTAVAVVDDGGRLVGEISPAALSLCGAAGALTVLTAGELMAYVDCGGPHRDMVCAVKARLVEKGLMGMVEFMEEEEDDVDEDDVMGLLSSTTSTDSPSSSSDEDAGEEKRRAGRKWGGSTGSYSSRMGWGSEEAIVCYPGSSLVAVMVQALAHRVSYVWVVEDDYKLAGVVVFSDVLRVFREQLSIPPSAATAH